MSLWIGPILIGALLAVTNVSTNPTPVKYEMKIEVYVNENLIKTVGPFDTTEKIFVGIKMKNGKILGVDSSRDIEELKGRITRLNMKSPNALQHIKLKIYIGNALKKTIENNGDGDFFFIIEARQGEVLSSTSESSSVSVFRSSDSNGNNMMHQSSSSSYSSSSSSMSSSEHPAHVGFIDHQKMFEMPMIKFPDEFPFNNQPLKIDFPDMFPFSKKKSDPNSSAAKKKKDPFDVFSDMPFQYHEFENMPSQFPHFPPLPPLPPLPSLDHFEPIMPPTQHQPTRRLLLL